MGVYRRKVGGKALKTWAVKFTVGGVLYRKGGFPDRESAQHWQDSTRLALRRGETGYVKAKVHALVDPLVQGFVASLERSGRSETYCRIMESRLNVLCRSVPWKVVGDVNPIRFNQWRASRPKWKSVTLSARTLNQYADIARQFGDYLKEIGCWPLNRMAEVGKFKAKVNERYRRAASLDELRKLLATAPDDRRLLYRFLVYVPIRRRAVEGLTWGDINLASEPPTVTVRPELSKTGTKAVLPLRKELADLLRAAKGGASAEDRVFGRVPSIKVFKRDLAAAGIDFSAEDGSRRFDLHAFRKTAVRLMKAAGVSLDDAHLLLQHRERSTTARYYDDDKVEPRLTDAAERMPSI